MAYNYLGLVNKVAHRVNEVELTSGNFATATAWYNTAKDAVNASIRHINQDEYEWPFNWTSYNETLTAGDMRYSLQSDCKSVDYDTFRIQRNATFGNDTQSLRKTTYDQYVQGGHIDDEYNSSDTGIRDLPRFVAEAQGREYVIWPSPNEAYTLTYEYYQLPTDLSAYDDVPSLPVAFETTIVNGAMYYLYLFRGDHETADRLKRDFEKEVKNLRGIYINRYVDVTDTRIPRNVIGKKTFVES